MIFKVPVRHIALLLVKGLKDYHINLLTTLHINTIVDCTYDCIFVCTMLET